MPIRGWLDAMTRCVGALALAAAILWQVAENSGPEGCRAVVHVTEQGVDVKIDDSAHRVETWRDSPVVLGLRPGRHTLRMSRRGRVLYEEVFTLRRGDDVVLTAWDATRRRGVRPRPDPSAMAVR